MSDASTTLLAPFEEKPMDDSVPGVRSFTISVQGDGHCQAIVNAVVGHYNRITGREHPEYQDLLRLMGEKVTLIMCGETMFGAGLVKAQEGTIFAGSAPETIGLLPKRSRRNGFRVNPERVLDVFPGYCTAKAQEMVDRVRSYFPAVTEIDRARLEQLPEYDGERDQEITLCAFGTWNMPDGAATDAIQLIATYDREDDICDGGCLLIRPEIGFSEHGSCYGRQITSSFGEVVGFQPITFARALELCDVPFDEAFKAIIPTASGRS